MSNCATLCTSFKCGATQGEKVSQARALWANPERLRARERGSDRPSQKNWFCAVSILCILFIMLQTMYYKVPNALQQPQISQSNNNTAYLVWSPKSATKSTTLLAPKLAHDVRECNTAPQGVSTAVTTDRIRVRPHCVAQCHIQCHKVPDCSGRIWVSHATHWSVTRHIQQHSYSWQTMWWWCIIYFW